MNSITGFLLNVLCLTLVFAMIGSVVWPIVCRLLRIGPWSTSTDVLGIVLSAVIFIIVRDYGHNLSDCVNKARSGTRWRKSVR